MTLLADITTELARLHNIGLLGQPSVDAITDLAQEVAHLQAGTAP